MKDRLRICADLAGSGDALAQKASIPRRTLETYLAGDADLKVPRMVAIADAAGVSVEWLATGRGPMLREEKRQIGDAYKPVTGTAFTPTIGTAVAAEQIDSRLLARVHQGVSEAYKAENVRIYADPLADEVARIYADLVAAYDSPEERLSGLKLALHQLRRSLQAPGAAGANSKQVS